MLLGFMLGALAMIGQYTFTNRVAAFAPIVILGVPIFDTAFVMGVRAVRGLPLMRGSPDHFAVRLRNHGVPSGRIALWGYGSGVTLGLLGLAMCWVTTEIALGLLGVAVLLALAAVIALWRLGRSPTDRPGIRPPPPMDPAARGPEAPKT
jgi:UDP-GlcNAc:undecaprenyl-phosphate GlcNAc-1-phosphate transferase